MLKIHRAKSIRKIMSITCYFQYSIHRSNIHLSQYIPQNIAKLIQFRYLLLGLPLKSNSPIAIYYEDLGKEPVVSKQVKLGYIMPFETSS